MEGSGSRGPGAPGQIPEIEEGNSHKVSKVGSEKAETEGDNPAHQLASEISEFERDNLLAHQDTVKLFMKRSAAGDDNHSDYSDLLAVEEKTFQDILDSICAENPPQTIKHTG